jgi:hypothetical protein
VLGEIREGVAWLWRRPFLRDGSLLYAALNLTTGAVTLLAVLVARHAGASSAAIGGAFACAGVGGILGAALAGTLRARVSPRAAVLAEPCCDVAVVPALLLCHSALAVGVVAGIYFLPLPLSSSVMVGRRLALVPSDLRGRVQASASFLSGSLGWLGPLAAGVVYEGAGQTVAILALTAWTVLVAIGALAARGFRMIP